MLLWVIIKTTDNGAKCLLTGLAIILRNQDRWEHYKLQINLFNNEGPYSVLAQSRLFLHIVKQQNMYSFYKTIFTWNLTDKWYPSQKENLVWICTDKNKNTYLVWWRCSQNKLTAGPFMQSFSQQLFMSKKLKCPLRSRLFSLFDKD